MLIISATYHSQVLTHEHGLTWLYLSDIVTGRYLLKDVSNRTSTSMNDTVNPYCSIRPALLSELLRHLYLDD